MSNCSECREVLTAAFEEVALALGGVVAGFDHWDDAVWELATAIDVIHRRALGRLAQSGPSATAAPPPPEHKCHPAIAHLVKQIREVSVG